MRTILKITVSISFIIMLNISSLFAQGNCSTVAGANPVLRSEGQTELTSAVLLNCSAIATGQAVSLDVTVNNGTVPITNRPAEGLLTIIQAGISTVYPSTLVSVNGAPASSSIRFSGINITDSAPMLVITGVRANVTAAFVPLTGIPFGQLFATVVASAGVLPITLPDAGLSIGIVLPGSGALTLFSSPNIDPCQATVTLDPASAFTFSMQTNFPGAFKAQGFSGTPPGSADSESGPDVNEPQASSATQFAVTIGGSVPAQLAFYIPATITSANGAVAQMDTAEGGSIPASPVANTVLATIGATYFYNILSSDSTKLQAFSLSLTTDPINAVSFALTDFSPTLAVALAPIATDLGSNVPRFQQSVAPLNFGYNAGACAAPQAPAVQPVRSASKPSV